MAGSYNHVVHPRTGNLLDNEGMMFSGMIENLGDAYEAIEEMYGMIWFLAWQSVAPHISLEEFKSLQYAREMVKDIVEHARRSSRHGRDVSEEILAHSPGRVSG